MTQTTEQLLEAVLELPDEDRLELVEALIGSFESPDGPPIDESWRPVIRRRSKELSEGRVTAVPWAEVKRRARPPFSCRLVR